MKKLEAFSHSRIKGKKDGFLNKSLIFALKKKIETEVFYVGATKVKRGGRERKHSIVWTL